MRQSEIPLEEPMQSGEPAADSSRVIYEQPLSERMRTFLRLEFLFVRIRQHLIRNSEWDARAVISSLLEILNVVTRGDLKSEVLKEMDRQRGILRALTEMEGVDVRKLGNVLDRLDQIYVRMRAERGQLAAALRDDEFIGAIRHRSAIPGGTCRFDLPAFHHWLSLPAERRAQDLGVWLAHLEPLREALALMLTMVRESEVSQRQAAVAGSFQRDMDPAHPYQLVRVELPRGVGYYPEISGSKHRFTMRFLSGELNHEPGAGRAEQIREDVVFWLTLCRL
jgi:cell division protein ZapD